MVRIFHRYLEFDEPMSIYFTFRPLYDRVIKAVNYFGKLSLTPEGQEGFAVIQYNPGDEYL